MMTTVVIDVKGNLTSGSGGKVGHPCMAELGRVVQAIGSGHRGVEVHVLDVAFVAFLERASDAVLFAVGVQRALREPPWHAVDSTPEAPGKAQPIDPGVRIGMHTGEVRSLLQPAVAIDAFGATVKKAARLAAAAQRGQVLLSDGMRLFAQAGLPPEITFQDLGQHRLKSVGEEHICQVTAPGLRPQFPSIATLPAEKHNLPVPLTPFVGRAREVDEWTSRLRERDTRLLTISGFGGMGKTRIALQIAEECLHHFEDGVWWISLESATSAEEMIQRIAEPLVKSLKPQPSVREQLWNFHRHREFLLVLDNMDQIERSEVAQVLIGLLNAGPRVKVLATSRHRLEMAPERHVKLDGFSLVEARLLFVERAQACQASFILNTTNAADVEAICHKLDGIPLAIEIAASRIAGMTPRQILTQLEAQVKAVAAGDSALKPRHQALLEIQGIIEWSYNLLEEEAKAVFSQVSVFVGGFYLEAALAVLCPSDKAGASNKTGASNRFDEVRVEGALRELRNQSLLRSSGDERQCERLTMLGVVREYAQAKLQAKREDDHARRQHAAYFCAWVEEQVGQLRTSSEDKVLHAVEAEFDNLRAAISWAEMYDPILCVRLVLSFHQPLHLRGHWEEAAAYLRKGWEVAPSVALTGAENSQVFTLRAALRHHQASLLHDIGQLNEARRLALESVELSRAGPDAKGAANTLNLLAVLANEASEYEAADLFCEEALGLWPQNHHAGRGKAVHNRGRAAQGRGHQEEARHWYQEALALRRLAGDQRGMAITLSNLGTLAQLAGHLDEARQHYRESLQLVSELGQPPNIAVMLNNLGEIDALEGYVARAMVLFIHAERILRDLKSPFATEPAKALEALRERMGYEQYEHLRREAESQAWEDYMLPGGIPAQIWLRREPAAQGIPLGDDFPTVASGNSIQQEVKGDEDVLRRVLTRRQRDILQRTARGDTTREIAQALFITEKTVYAHRAQMIERMGLADINSLIRYALSKGWILPCLHLAFGLPLL